MNKQLIICILLLLVLPLGLQAQHRRFNMVQLSHWDSDSLNRIGNQKFNDIWGWYDSVKDKEYAIVGSIDSTYFFDVSNPAKTPKLCDVKAGKAKNSIWRDYDTYKHYCYAVQDAGAGALQVFDLSYLPDSVHTVYYSDSLLARSHTIFRAGDKLYCNSATTKTGTRRACQILSLADPEKPVIAGIVTPPIFDGSPAFNLCHDSHVHGDTMYCSGENAGLFIYNISNPGNPQFKASLTDYPEKGYNHSSWLSQDGKYLFFTDENKGLGIKAYSISDFNNIQLQSVFRSNVGALAHNPYVRENKLFVSYYEDGVYVFDVSDPKNVVMIAYYDTYPQNPEGQYSSFNGCWSAYPFLPSGIVLALDQTNGLFVLGIDKNLSTEEVGVEEFNIHPNPLQDGALSVNIVNSSEKEVAITITDALGRQVYRSEHEVTEGLNSVELQVPENLKQGIYFVTITGRISNICKKILKP